LNFQETSLAVLSELIEDFVPEGFIFLINLSKDVFDMSKQGRPVHRVMDVFIKCLPNVRITSGSQDLLSLLKQTGMGDGRTDHLRFRWFNGCGRFIVL